jgi:hypothetical protein
VNHRYVYSIDPGVNGAIVRWDHPSGNIQINDITIRDAELGHLSTLHALLARTPATVILEHTHAMPLGGIANFRQGNTRGVILAMIAAHGHRLIEVRPQDWKRDLGLPKSKTESLKMARAFYPCFAESHLRRKKDHDRAEALLIGHWYHHHYREDS